MSLKAFSAGPAAMIGQIIRELGIIETIDNMVKSDQKQCKHSPGTHILAMLINIVMGRTALYRVDECRTVEYSVPEEGNPVRLMCRRTGCGRGAQTCRRR